MFDVRGAAGQRGSAVGPQAGLLYYFKSVLLDLRASLVHSALQRVMPSHLMGVPLGRARLVLYNCRQTVVRAGPCRPNKEYQYYVDT
jgi:hypothetical protein